MGAFFKRVRDWYGRWERPLSSLSLISGFVFDAIALPRVDEFFENFWVAAHLVIIAVAIIFINAIENEGGAEKDPAKIHFWLVNILQFFFGGVLSVFIVFYFRSGSILIDWPFLLILVLAFIANESLKRHFARLTFQVGFFFLSLFAFAIFLVPVIVHQIGPLVFLLSGFASLACIGLFLLILKFFTKERFAKNRLLLSLTILGIFFGINILYFYNLIPPIPLSLKSAGVYQAFIVNGPGNYTVGGEPQGPFAFFNLYQDVHLTPGADLYAYSAVFSPTSFSTTVIHEWQYYDANSGSWVTRGRIPLSVVGGGDGGYRTFSEETGFTPGKWRVNVETPGGAVIGRLDFNVVTVSTTPALITQTIN